MIDYASIGQKVREKRLKRGITQEPEIIPEEKPVTTGKTGEP